MALLVLLGFATTRAAFFLVVFFAGAAPDAALFEVALAGAFLAETGFLPAVFLAEAFLTLRLGFSP